MARRRQSPPSPGPTGGPPTATGQQPMRYFVCATNRPNLGVGGQTLEDLMHDRNCAAMWDYLPEHLEVVHYVSHVARVQTGHRIFMFARGGVGIIGVGSATGAYQGPLLPGNPVRIRDQWNAPEYQVPVVWLSWQPNNPCPFNGLNGTFYEMSSPVWAARRNAVIQHFALDNE